MRPTERALLAKAESLLKEEPSRDREDKKMQLFIALQKEDQGRRISVDVWNAIVHLLWPSSQ